MSRVILVSNRVLDLRKASQAGGVAVALADIVRTRPSLWFGWNGEIKPAEESGAVTREGRIATVPLSQSEHDRYYLGYANSVLWPVFHGRLDLAHSWSHRCLDLCPSGCSFGAHSGPFCRRLK